MESRALIVRSRPSRIVRPCPHCEPKTMLEVTTGLWHVIEVSLVTDHCQCLTTGTGLSPKIPVYFGRNGAQKPQCSYQQLPDTLSVCMGNDEQNLVASNTHDSDEAETGPCRLIKEDFRPSKACTAEELSQTMKE